MTMTKLTSLQGAENLPQRQISYPGQKCLTPFQIGIDEVSEQLEKCGIVLDKDWLLDFLIDNEGVDIMSQVANLASQPEKFIKLVRE